MKRTPIAFLIVLVGAVATLVRAEDSEAIKKDMTLLQGEWMMVSGSADGEPMPDETRKQMKRVCKGDETTTTMAGQIYIKAKFSIDPTKQPRTIDYEMSGGFTQGQKQLGIYEVDADTFKSCFAKPDGERPSDFSNKPGDGRTFSVWKRVRPAESLSEPVAKLLAHLSATHGMWVNGLFSSLRSPETASPTEVVHELLNMGLASGETAHYEILKIEQVHVPDFSTGSDLYTAITIRKDSSDKIVLIQFKGAAVGWWTRVYDIKPSPQ
jgi:uncharacterized protein (TIGR03067 family)